MSRPSRAMVTGRGGMHSGLGLGDVRGTADNRFVCQDVINTCIDFEDERWEEEMRAGLVATVVTTFRHHSMPTKGIKRLAQSRYM